MKIPESLKQQRQDKNEVLGNKSSVSTEYWSIKLKRIQKGNVSDKGNVKFLY